MHISKFYLLNLCLLLTISIFPARGSTDGQYSVTHYNDENGLPQNSIKGIARDSAGFIWLATESGLVRFDGQGFLTYDKSKVKITSNRIFGFVPDPENSREGSGFSALTENHEHLQILTNGTARVNTRFPALYSIKFPVRSKWSTTLDILMSIPSYLFAGYPFHAPYFLKSKNGQYFMWLNDQVEKYEDGHLIAKFDAALTAFFLIDSLPVGRLPDGSFVRFSNTSVRPMTVNGDLDLGSPYIAERSRIFWDCSSNQAYLYYGKSLYTLTSSGDGHTLLTTLVLEGFDFDANNIQTVYHDKERSLILLGSYTKGLYLIKERKFSTLVSRKTGFGNVFYAQMPPLFRTKNIEDYHFDPPVLIDGMSKNFVAQNSDGTFWMGKGTKVCRFTADAKKVLVTVNFRWDVRAIYRDQFNTLWVASALDTLYAAENSAETPQFRLAAKGKFGEILCMARVSAEQLLLGTRNGLFILSIASGKVSYFKGLYQKHVRSLLQTGDDIWITTYGDGLYRLTKNKLIKLPLDKNGYLATSHCIIEDSQGYFWISTNKGLFQASKVDLQKVNHESDQVFYQYYDKSNGFNSNEFNGGCQPCGLAGSDGLLYFPTMEGVVRFDPNSIKPSLPDKPVFVSHIGVDGRLFSSEKPIELPRSFNEVEISLTTPYFGTDNNLNVFYSFDKEGHQPAWFRVPGDLVIRKPNQGPGKYALLVKKIDGFGNAVTVSKLAILTVQPAWYETAIFKCLMVVSILWIFWIILKKRSNYLVSEQKRKSIYRQYHLSSRIVAAITHDIQTPLHYISRCLHEVILPSQDHSHTLSARAEMSSEAIDTIERTRARIANLLQYIKSQTRSNSVTVKSIPVDLHEVIENALGLLAGMATFRQVVVSSSVPMKTYVQTDADLLPVIIHNVLDNAIKFSDSKVHVTSSCRDDFHTLIVENTGAVIPGATADWINKKHQTYDEWMLDQEYPEDTGLGLMIIKDLCILLGIQLVVFDLEFGVCFSLSFLASSSKARIGPIQRP
jgi:hypothetical protein